MAQDKTSIFRNPVLKISRSVEKHLGYFDKASNVMGGELIILFSFVLILRGV